MLETWISPARRRSAFWLCLAVVLVMALVPPSHYVPTTPWDKLNHALAFAVLAVLGMWSYPGRLRATLLGLLAYGGLIEVLQGFTSYRSAEWADLLADAIGLVIGWQLARVLRRVRQAVLSAEPTGRSR